MTGEDQGRTAVLAAGREAAVERRRADSEACRQRVRLVIENMQRRSELLSDAEILRRAQVNSQFLQRHRDLRAMAALIRGEIRKSQVEQMEARQDERVVSLRVENQMLTAQVSDLRSRVRELTAELKAARAAELAAEAMAGPRRPDDPHQLIERLRSERDRAVTEAEAATREITALRTLNQRLMIDRNRPTTE